MSDRNLILTLAKVIIAAAWADGEVTLEEINSLKDLLFRLPHPGHKGGTRIPGREWAMLEMYIESPVGAEERARLMEELQAALRTPKDRALALSALENLIQADGVVTDEERAVMEKIKMAVEAVDLGIIGQLGRLIRGPVQRRSQAVANAPNREEHLEDFIRNKVYYALRQRLSSKEADLAPEGRLADIPEADLRKLSLAGGLMARVAHVDQEVTEGQFDVMVNALQASWDVSPETAAFVAEVALSQVSAGLDFFRLTREFFTSTTEDERLRFLDILLAVANADGQISYYENEELLRIASSLNLTRKQFADARLKIPTQPSQG
jgi:uncharacterized tellurite resistance protein B-like protein